MNPEIQIYLNKFIPRKYQLPICNAIATEGGKFKKILAVMPRRAGKDILMFNLMIRAALKQVGNYFYCLPTFSQARSVIWESITNQGTRFLDFIPPQLIKNINNVEMKITFINGSQIKLIGSDSYNTSIIGTNPRMIVFSEYALADENAYKLAALPILRANDGVVCLISTPRGQNHMYELYQIAKNNPDWFSYFLTIEDTNHISIHEIKKEIESGEISEDMAQQEYWCSWHLGQEGSYYAKHLDKMRLRGQIGIVPWEPYHKVHTAWDLGIKDPTVVLFFQCVGEIIRIIDYYQASDHGMDHFAKLIYSKPYTYGYHFPPHDIMARESARGLTKKEMYKELGIKFTEPVMIDIEDGIELCRRSFSKIWIDEQNCKQLIKSLEGYREEYDTKRKIYKGRPLHDHCSHAADAFRYMCAALPKTKDGLSPETLEKRYKEAMFGIQSNLPSVFRTDLPEY
jgi:phage terminase large subunit